MTHSHRARCENQRLVTGAATCGRAGTETREDTPICDEHAEAYDLGGGQR